MHANQRSNADRDAFLTARKSLRIWPIEGNTNEDLEHALEDFCVKALGARRESLHIDSVRRVKSAPRGVAHMEVVAVFSDSYARDDILTRGPMLSDFHDEENKPTAGLRLEIPSHLMGAFKTLEAFAYSLKRRHGPSLRKHIKFDEFVQNLYIQVGIKEEDKVMDWTTYTPDEARDGLKKLSAKRGPHLDLLATPVKEHTDGPTSKRATDQLLNKKKSSWIPPQRKKNESQAWRSEKEFDIDDHADME